MAKIRTQIQLEEMQYRMLKEESFRLRISLSEIIRTAIERAFSPSRKLSKKKKQKALSIIGIGKSGLKDLALHHDKYFVESIE